MALFKTRKRTALGGAGAGTDTPRHPDAERRRRQRCADKNGTDT